MFFLFGIARCCCRAPLLDVYCFGGLAANPNDMVAQMDGYRNATDSWTSRAPLPSERRLHAGASAGGVGYSIGGQGPASQIDDNDAYTALADIWTSRADLPSPARNQLGTVGIDDGEAANVYAFAGAHFAGVPVDSIQTDSYDPAGDAWTSQTDKPAPALRAPAYTAINLRAYAWGGFAGNGTTFGGTRAKDNDEFDPAGDSWTSKLDLPDPARDAVQGGGSIDGKGYVYGGRSQSFPAPQTGIDQLDEYDPTSDSWTTKSPGNAPRAFLALCASESRIHAFGGDHLSTTQSVNHQSYEPVTDTWLALEPLPPLERTQAAAFAP